MSGFIEGADGRVRALARLTIPWGWLIPGAILFWFTLPTFGSLHTVWSTFNYSHGYLVLVLAALLVIAEIRRAPLADRTPSWAGLVALLGLVLVTTAGRLTATQDVELLAWPLVWIAAIWAWAGWRNARRFIPALGYLLVAIPIWDFFVEPLRRLTVAVVSMWIRFAGMPALIDGNLIHVPSGTFEVAEGCAGFRYALVAVALAAFVSLLDYRRWRPAVLLILCALALTAVGNWFRVFITVAVGLNPGGVVDGFVRDEHTFFGWIMFVVFLAPIVIVHRRLSLHAAPDSPAAAEEPKSAVALGAGSITYASCGILVLAIAATYLMESAAARVPRAVPLENPEIAGWTREADWQDTRLPLFGGATARDATWYADGTTRVGAFVATFANQAQGREVASLGNDVAGTNAVTVARQTVTVTTHSGSTVPFREIEVTDPGGRRRLVWTGLRVAGKLTTSDVAAKVLQLGGAIRGRRDAQALVLTASCGQSCDEARSSLLRFAATAAEPLLEEAERIARVAADPDAAPAPVER